MKPYSQHQIEELLTKFMEGNTTIEEESLLSEYFSTTPNIPAEWADYKAMFGYLDRGLEGDLLPESASPTHRKRLWWISISAAAAVVALVFGLKVLNNTEATKPVSRPIAAQNEAKKGGNHLVAKNEKADISTPATDNAEAVAVEPQRKSTTHHQSQADLMAQNEQLQKENERLHRELEELNQRAIIIDMEAMGYQAVMDENGTIVYVDAQQEINQQFNNQSTPIPAL
mgnify:CR=1 FL=1